MVPLMTLLVTHDANTDTSGVTWTKFHVTHPFDHLDLSNAKVPHDDRSHVVPNFNHLDIGNAVVPLMTPSALHDTGSNTNGVT